MLFCNIQRLTKSRNATTKQTFIRSFGTSREIFSSLTPVLTQRMRKSVPSTDTLESLINPFVSFSFSFVSCTSFIKIQFWILLSFDFLQEDFVNLNSQVLIEIPGIFKEYSLSCVSSAALSSLRFYNVRFSDI